jgi:hypothetical protein
MEGEALVEFVGEGVPGPFPSVNLRSLRIRGRPLGALVGDRLQRDGAGLRRVDVWMRYHWRGIRS